MSVIIKNPLTIVQSGGGGLTKPTTWTGLKAMTATDLAAIFPAGSIIDSIECKIADTTGSTVRDFFWQVADYGTCQLENDNTDYPCVTLIAAAGLPTSLPFDGTERSQCDSTTETVAEDGVYYYGTTAASGTPTAADTTALALTTGDAIPYSDYARIFKSSINTTVANFISLYSYGYNNYFLSNIRQYLNASGAAGAWFSPSHVGDTLASQYNSHRGFMTGVPSDFLAVLAQSKITVTGNTVTDGGTVYTMYDKFFLPSMYEVQLVNTPVDGAKMDFITSPITNPAVRCKAYLGAAANGSADRWWLRSPNQSGVSYAYCVINSGNSNGYSADNTYRVVPACKIILAGA